MNSIPSIPVQKKELFPVIERLCQCITDILAEGDRYQRTYPKDILLGLSIYEPSSKKLTEEYYTYASRICNIVSEPIESAIADCSSLLLRADDCMQCDLVSICGKILSAHEIFSAELRRFLHAMEQIFLTRDAKTNMNAATNELRLFHYRINAVKTDYLATLQSLQQNPSMK